MKRRLPWLAPLALFCGYHFSVAFCGMTIGVIRRQNVAKEALPPGKAKLPIFGDTLEILNPKKMLSYQLERRERWGASWTTSVLFKKAVVITGQHEMSLARKHESRPKAFEAFFPPHHQKLFGESSLLVQSGLGHQRLRRLIQSAMVPKAVERFKSFIDVAIGDFLESCRRERGYFSMTKKLQETTLRIVVQVLLGEDLPEEDLEYLRRNLRIWAVGLLSAPLNFIPWSNAARAMRARGKVEEILLKWIEERSKKLDDTLLSQLIRATDEDGSALSTKEIVDNVFTLVFAGIDTTASTLSSSFKKLSQDTELQKLLREKLQGPEGERYLDAFLTEILRTNPPAPFAMRLVREPLKLENVTVPAGYLLVYGLGASLSDECYEKPDEFQLMRAWNQSVTTSGAFGGGPRLCPGRYLAAQSAQQVLAAVLGPEGFHWKLKEDQKLEQEYSPGLFPIDGLMLELS